MTASLLTNAAWFVVLAIVLGAIASTARSVASAWSKKVTEKERTARLNAAIKDSTPQERVEIIIACGQLEGRDTTEPAKQDPAPTSTPDEDSLVARLLREVCGVAPEKE
jgi:hypothetical protein